MRVGRFVTRRGKADGRGQNPNQTQEVQHFHGRHAPTMHRNRPDDPVVNLSNADEGQSPSRSPRLGISIWQKTEEARSKAANSSAVQNMERDAPWTAWDRMSQPHEDTGGPPMPLFEEAASSIHNPRSTSQRLRVNSRLDHRTASDASSLHVRRKRRISHARRVVRPRGGMALMAGG